MSRCRVVSLADGSRVRVQGDLDADVLEAMAAAVRAVAAARCTAESTVPMPDIAQRIHGREHYRCGRRVGHDGPHRWPAESGRFATWEDES